MDLNQLLYHHQVALIREGTSALPASGLIEHYARKVRELRLEMGLIPGREWQSRASAAG